MTATASEPLAAVSIAKFSYDGNNDGFTDAGVGTVLTEFTGTPTAPSDTFVATFNLGVGPAGASFTPGTSTMRLSPGAITNASAITNPAQIIAIAIAASLG